MKQTQVYKVGIVGYGVVGLACETGLQSVAEIRIYDKYKASESLYDVVNNSDIIFVCVPSPMDEETGACNTSFVFNACKEIDKNAEKNKTIVIKSTVIPGTTKFISKKYKKHTFIFNPEFLTERNFINDFLEQDRIILGTCSKDKKKAKNLWQVFQLYSDFEKTKETSAEIVVVNSEEAEMVKYITNCFLATKLSFFNEMHDICKVAKIDYNSVLRLLKMDKRIGRSHYNVPGSDGRVGWSGSCFPKDINALIAYARDLEVDSIVMESAWAKNLLVREEYDWEKLPQVTGKYKKRQ